jgi:hypothetical protein
MKKEIVFSVLLFLISSLSTFSQTCWLIENTPNFIIETKVEGDNLIAYSRKGALKDYFSPIKWYLIKKKYQLEHDELFNCKGVYSLNHHAYLGIYKMFYDTPKRFKMSISNNDLTLILYSENDSIYLKGKKVDLNYSQNNYNQLYKSIFEKTDSNIFNSNYLKTLSFRKAKKELENVSHKIRDDYEFYYSFYLSTTIARQLNFTHFYLKTNTSSSKTPSIVLREINSNTCVLDIDGFQGDRLKIDSLINKIQSKNYQNLIIDLRNNGGGTFETASSLGNFISTKPIIAGLFPNRNWYDKTKSYPTIADTNEFTSFNNGTLEQFFEIANTKSGVYIETIPNDKPFKGNLYLLVNNQTASTAEVVTMAFKEYKLGTIVGTKTSGALLSMKWFKLNDLFEIGIPTNDFVSVHGFRVDKKGIEPDIKTGSKDALNHTLELIKQKEIFKNDQE